MNGQWPINMKGWQHDKDAHYCWRDSLLAWRPVPRLGFGIHGAASLDPSPRALMEMLNAGAVLMSFFFAYASLLHQEVLMKTGLGRSVIWMMIGFLSRAAGEIVFFDFGWLWFGVRILIAAMYAVVLFSLHARNE